MLWISVVVSMLVPYEVAEAASGQGVLDLSAWNSEEEPRLRLDGTWYFFDNELLTAREVIERLPNVNTFAGSTPGMDFRFQGIGWRWTRVCNLCSEVTTAA